MSHVYQLDAAHRLFSFFLFFFLKFLAVIATGEEGIDRLAYSGQVNEVADVVKGDGQGLEGEHHPPLRNGLHHLPVARPITTRQLCIVAVCTTNPPRSGCHRRGSPRPPQFHVVRPLTTGQNRFSSSPFTSLAGFFERKVILRHNGLRFPQSCQNPSTIRPSVLNLRHTILPTFLII